MGSPTIHDAIVVGSGAAGSWVAKELTEGGREVVLLEAGRDLDALRDFPSGARRASSPAFRLGARLRGQYVQACCAFFAPHTRQFYVNDREDPYTTPAGRPFRWYRGRQLGGRLHTWARHAPRIGGAGFTPGDDASDDRRWPISYDELAPYYAKVERTLGVFGRREGISEMPDGEFLAPDPLTPFEDEFCRRVTDAAPTVHVTPARNVRHNPGRIPIPLTLASRTGRLHVETDAIVRHVLVDADTGRAKGVLVVDRNDHRTREVFGRVIVLAASAFESVRILLNSACPRHPAGIGGSSGVLGRFISDHLVHWTVGTVSSSDVPDPSSREPADAYDWAPTRLYIPDLWHHAPSGDCIGRYGVQISFARAAGMPVASMSFLGEMTPRFENRLTIDRSRDDAWGIPVVHIDCTHSDRDLRLVQQMREAGRELTCLAGLEPFELKAPAWSLSPAAESAPPGTAIHETGGARMGSDPRRSVLDKYNRCWDCPNVFVADGACFPYAPYASPTLTIMALAVRACDHILHEPAARTA